MQETTQAEIEVFQYPAGLAPPMTSETFALFAPLVTDGESPSGLGYTKAEDVGRVRGSNEDTAALQESFETGRLRGLEEGREAERAAQEAARTAESQERARQMASLLNTFAAERDKYLRAVEHEVATLALAIAARILRREAQMDPLFLTGAVRVALGQLASTTKVAVRVPPSELALWQEAIAHLPHRALQAAVLSSDAMITGDCVLETEIGSVDLGLSAQLREIERGFFGNPSAPGPEPSSPAVSAAFGENPQ
ncbi:MAG: FliH/SctL family protein [Terracidiphilus sp.]